MEEWGSTNSSALNKPKEVLMAVDVDEAIKDWVGSPPHKCMSNLRKGLMDWSLFSYLSKNLKVRLKINTTLRCRFSFKAENDLAL
jgi:hypothetical protein